MKVKIKKKKCCPRTKNEKWASVVLMTMIGCIAAMICCQKKNTPVEEEMEETK